VVVTAIPRLAQSVGANRIVLGRAIPYPFGDPGMTREGELLYRRRVVEASLAALRTMVQTPTIFEPQDQS
jgi:betaine reductase